MRWKMKEGSKSTNWETVYAWRPVLTQDRTWVWLEFVERKFKINVSSGNWVYRIPVDTNTSMEL